MYRFLAHDIQMRHVQTFPVESSVIHQTDLFEDLAAEQKARSTYDNILRVVTDPDVCEPIRFLRKREIVHFQRFGEALDYARDYLKQQHYFFMQKNGCNS